MPTAGKAFLQVVSGPVKAVSRALAAAAAAIGTRVDSLQIDFASDSLTKHGFNSVNLTGTTPVTFDLTDLTSNATSYDGDTTFASWSTLMLRNTGGADVTVGPGASNPARLLLGGTTPTLTIPAGQAIPLSSGTPVGIDSTHKTLTVTPTAGGSFVLGVSGA